MASMLTHCFFWWIYDYTIHAKVTHYNHISKSYAYSLNCDLSARRNDFLYIMSQVFSFRRKKTLMLYVSFPSHSFFFSLTSLPSSPAAIDEKEPHRKKERKRRKWEELKVGDLCSGIGVEGEGNVSDVKEVRMIPMVRIWR